jgi:hypothetical protein
MTIYLFIFIHSFIALFAGSIRVLWFSQTLEFHWIYILTTSRLDREIILKFTPARLPMQQIPQHAQVGLLYESTSQQTWLCNQSRKVG